MSDNPGTPVQPETPVQQVQGTSVKTAPEGYIELARYNGLVRKVEELTLTGRSLQEQLTQKASEIEQLKGQLAVKDTEKQVAVNERDGRINSNLQELATLKAELAELRGLKKKVDVMNKLGRTELASIIQRIPSIEDEAALEEVMKDYLKFGDQMVEAREKQLLAGVTPTTGPGRIEKPTPQTPEEWENHVNSLPLGSKERATALSEMGVWLENTYSKQL